MIKKLNKLNTKREKLIAKLSKELKKLIRDQQSDLYDEISDVLEDLALDNGNLKFTSSNIQLTNRVQKVITKYTNENRNKFIAKIIAFANDIIKVTNDIYTLVATKLDKKVRDKATNLLFKSLGFDLKGKKLIKDGYLDTLTNNKAFATRISQRLINSVSAGQGSRQFKKEFRQDFLGQGKNALGFLEREFNLFTSSFLSQVDSSISKQYADELELEYFLYIGVDIRDSRKFCKARRGNHIYTREEINSWDLLSDWKGRIKGVSVWIARGGHNCTDALTPISKELKDQLVKQGYTINTYN